jgi:prevent-host-death family protein
MHGHRKYRKKIHKVWQLQEAKAKFSELVDEVLQGGYHIVTRNGNPVVVVISQKEFEQYRKSEDTLIDFFCRAPFPEEDLDLTRDKDIARDRFFDCSNCHPTQSHPCYRKHQGFH